ncbi:2-methylcitrate dehydratase [Rhizodiscina lignyota]|uniref:2-methylcitrate dehydratase n=1 Tax=Rhizodiscina lignyota TaxID=1504668 RepID=A0A9P4M1Q8_9PEZI|nr:2-methylcitrate dehydratase [Rhizodiscina lignyota]
MNGQSPSTRPPTTAEYAKFVAQLQYNEIPTYVIDKLRILLLDYLGVAVAGSHLAESTRSFVTGIKKVDGGGHATVIGDSQSWAPNYAALINGALAHSLDFDDTHMGGAVHPGASVISAALAETETNPSASTADMLTALAAGYEITCRLGVSISAAGYAQGFHNTGTVGIFGSVAAIARLRNLEASVIENAFGIAISLASGSMQFLSNGSWTKRLHPGFAAHNAFICVSLAEAGTMGAAEPIEGKFGLFKAYANRTFRGVTLPLKQHWEFVKTAIKPYPACRMTHGYIELADKLGEKRREGVKRITLGLAKAGWPIVGEPKPNKVHPENIVDAQFSAYYQTAVAWLKGSTLGWKVYDFLDEPPVRELADNITVEINKAFKGLETSLRVEYSDGSVAEEYLKEPRGEPGNPITWEAERDKFLGITTEVLGEKRAKRVCDVVEHFEKFEIRALLELLAKRSSVL